MPGARPRVSSRGGRLLAELLADLVAAVHAGTHRRPAARHFVSDHAGAGPGSAGHRRGPRHRGGYRHALAAEGWPVLAVDRCADDPCLPSRWAPGRTWTPWSPRRRAAPASWPAWPPTSATTRPWPPPWRRPSSGGAAWTPRSRWPASSRVACPADAGRPGPGGHGIDLGGVLKLARGFIPALLRRPEPRHGRFLAVASAAATRGLPMLAAYCAAKAGVAGLIRALATGCAGPASPPTRSARAPPTRRSSPRAPGCTGCPAPGRSPPSSPSTGCSPRGGGRGAGLAGRRRQQRDDRRGGPGGRRAGPVSVAQ